MTLAAFLLSAPADGPATEDQAAWWDGFLVERRAWSRPLEQAAAGGFRADRLAWAFCAGYQSALRRLLPSLPDDRMATFCATEAGGNGPKAIRTRLAMESGACFLSGEKSWASLAGAGSRLIVVARTNDPAETRPALKVAHVAASSPGVDLRPMPAPGFVPEISHARVLLDRVPVAPEDILAGDGYDAYLKPFRAIEDIHVTVAVLAMLIREGRARQWPQQWIQKALAAVMAFAAIDAEDYSNPAGHIVLAGALGLAGESIGQADGFWAEAAAGDAAHQRWERDHRLLDVASSARKARIESAWGRMAPSPGPA